MAYRIRCVSHDLAAANHGVVFNTGPIFTIGVPFDFNHNDAATAPSPLNLSGLVWMWDDGYEFMRIDAVPTTGSAFLDASGHHGLHGGCERQSHFV